MTDRADEIARLTAKEIRESIDAAWAEVELGLIPPDAADEIASSPYGNLAERIRAYGDERAREAAEKMLQVEAPTTLVECPIGLFVSDDNELCLKSEYGSNEGRIDAYIVSSGEFFWGAHPQTIQNQRKQRVRPVSLALPLPADPRPAGATSND